MVVVVVVMTMIMLMMMIIHLHYSIYKALGMGRTNGMHTAKPICELDDVTVLWNKAAHTDREVMANRPDIITENKREKTCILIDVAMPVDRNLI
jgi:hypothetical protein